VAFDVDGLVLEFETYPMATVIAGWERLAMNACNFMRLVVLRVVNNRVNTGGIAFFSGLKNIAYLCHNRPPYCSLGRIVEESRCVGGSSKSGF
jgi:hypothetical protein